MCKPISGWHLGYKLQTDAMPQDMEEYLERHGEDPGEYVLLLEVYSALHRFMPLRVEGDWEKLGSQRATRCDDCGCWWKPEFLQPDEEGEGNFCPACRGEVALCKRCHLPYVTRALARYDDHLTCLQCRRRAEFRKQEQAAHLARTACHAAA